ncbi:MAG: DUF2264 domain-containing protein [Spirochaetaceae bacterium]|nr:MAG: DUF2264 domain-containing protein [Spirochaetaceae bacterium]
MTDPTLKTDSPRGRWLRVLERLATPVLEAAAKGCLHEALRPDHHPDADPNRLASSHLEAVGRLLLGIAPWLAGSGGDADEKALRERLSAQARTALCKGFNPGHADWFSLDRGQQPIVDAAFVASALIHGRSALWDPLEPEDRTRIAQGLESLRDRKPHFNNWLLFSGVTEAALATLGRSWDRMRVDYSLRQHEQWYLGDGVYGDGPQFHADWYNSYVIHPLLHTILRTAGHDDDAWAAALPLVEQRLTRYAGIQERSIAPDGSFPPVGRSLTYRAGAFHALAYAALHGLLPDAVSPASVRAALTAVMVRTLAAAGNWRHDGFLTIGLNGKQPSLGERYITTGSLYLCSVALLPLGLSPEHEFWQGPDEPWTSVRLFDQVSDEAADHAMTT